MKDDMKLLGLQSEWAIFMDMWRELYSVEQMDVFKIMVMMMTYNHNILIVPDNTMSYLFLSNMIIIIF